MIASQEMMDNIKRFGVGRRKLNDNIFAEDKTPPRLGIYDEDDEGLLHSVITTTCPAVGCTFKSDSLLEFENHYNSRHRFTCVLCKRNLPSPHLLDLHIQETHDSFFAVLAAKKPSFSCFIEECKEKFQTTDLRLEHCVKVHRLPKDFRFGPKAAQKKKKTQLSDKKQSIDIHKYNNSTSNQFVMPSCDTFSSNKEGSSKTVDIDEVMSDIQESLPL